MTVLGGGQKTIIFKLLLDTNKKTIILRGLRWPLNIICEEWKLKANRHLVRSVACEAIICEALLYLVSRVKDIY